MENTDCGTSADRMLDSIYFRNGAGLRRPQDSVHLTLSHLEGTQGSLNLSQVEFIMGRICETNDLSHYIQIQIVCCQSIYMWKW